jgi:catechol 2,3-dioxygenase-like lactoylglutathione lyase family enzyme
VLAARGIDHLVLCVRDVSATIAFYELVLGMTAREERPGKWSLHFGSNKLSLQDAIASPSIARRPSRAAETSAWWPASPSGGSWPTSSGGRPDRRRPRQARRRDRDDPLGVRQGSDGNLVEIGTRP